MTLREQIWIAACKSTSVIEEAKTYCSLPSLGDVPGYDWALVLRFVRMIMGNRYQRTLAAYPGNTPLQTLINYESFGPYEPVNYRPPEWYYIRDRRAIDFQQPRFNLNE